MRFVRVLIVLAAILGHSSAVTAQGLQPIVYVDCVVAPGCRNNKNQYNYGCSSDARRGENGYRDWRRRCAVCDPQLEGSPLFSSSGRSRFLGIKIQIERSYPCTPRHTTRPEKN